MTTDRRRGVRALAAILLFVGVFLALPLQHGRVEHPPQSSTSDVFSEPLAVLHYGRGQLTLAVSTRTAAQESALSRYLDEHFGGRRVQADFRPALLLPDNWTQRVENLIALAATTDSMEARLEGDKLAIRGVSRNAPGYRDRLEVLRQVLPEPAQIDADMIFLEPANTLAELCARNFAEFAVETISFAHSGTTIRQSAYPFLDRLVEFAHQCPAQTIVVVGHSDSTGDEAWNVKLSLARAEAVANLLRSRGVPADRLALEGRGSRQPLARNDSQQGRERNRRVTIELR